MTTWMLYAVLLGLGLGTGAVAVARVLRSRGRPERGVWAAALLGSVLLPLALPWTPRMGDAAVAVISLPGIATGPGDPAAGAGGAGWTADPWLLLAWAAATLVLALRLWWSTRRLKGIVARGRLMRRWPVEVRATEGTGPAVAGLRRPVLLLPHGPGSFEPRERRWILRHEFEHIRAGDPALIWLALVARTLMPWNPATWFLGRRLREAVEFDCDRRVLGRRPDPRSYGETLLALAHPGGSPALPAAAFREPLVSLKRRFFAMTTPRRPLTPRTLALIAALTTVGWIAACEFSPTYAIGEPEEVEIPAALDAVVDRDVDRLAENPTFTPFTAAPDIVNRDEVVAALEREYPPLLRDAGIGGTANIWFFIDPEGEVRDLRIQESSGHAELDEAAIQVASTIRFTPARNRGDPVPVWVAFPITFRVR